MPGTQAQSERADCAEQSQQQQRCRTDKVEKKRTRSASCERFEKLGCSRHNKRITAKPAVRWFAKAVLHTTIKLGFLLDEMLNLAFVRLLTPRTRAAGSDMSRVRSRTTALATLGGVSLLLLMTIVVAMMGQSTADAAAVLTRESSVHEWAAAPWLRNLDYCQVGRLSAESVV
jgi:hypothetical protein